MAFFDCDVRLYLGVPESEEFRSRSTIYISVEYLDAAYEDLAGEVSRSGTCRT